MTKSKRQIEREKRRRERIRNQILVILLVAGGALLIAFALILPTLKLTQGDATMSLATAAPRPADVQMDGRTMGDPNAPVKIDVWEDFQCSGCLYYSLNIEPGLIEKYVATGKVFYTYHFYPIIDGSNSSGESHQAANAALCAMEQGRFWDYHDLLFANWLGENVGSYTDARLLAMAESLGLNMDDFKSCFKANRYASIVEEDVAAGTELSIHATPTIFVNGQQAQSSAGPQYIPSLQDLSNLIDSLLGGQ